MSSFQGIGYGRLPKSVIKMLGDLVQTMKEYEHQPTSVLEAQIIYYVAILKAQATSILAEGRKQ